MQGNQCWQCLTHQKRGKKTGFGLFSVLDCASWLGELCLGHHRASMERCSSDSDLGNFGGQVALLRLLPDAFCGVQQAEFLLEGWTSGRADAMGVCLVCRRVWNRWFVSPESRIFPTKRETFCSSDAWIYSCFESRSEKTHTRLIRAGLTPRLGQKVKLFESFDVILQCISWN